MLRNFVAMVVVACTMGLGTVHADNRVLPVETWVHVPDTTYLHPGEEQFFVLREVHFLITRPQIDAANAVKLALERCEVQLEDARAALLEKEVETIDIPWPKWKWAAATVGVVAVFAGGVWVGANL